MKTLTLLLLCGMLAGCSQKSSVGSPFHKRMVDLSAGQDKGLSAISIENYPSMGKTRVVMVVWPDGRIIWSKDSMKGGPPLLEGTVDPAKVRQVLEKLEGDGLFTKPANSLFHVGPDASSHLIHLHSGKKEAKLVSWHELYEVNPKVVATSHGLGTLGDRKREDVLRGDTKEYQEFRKLWSEIRKLSADLIPKEGKPFTQPLDDARPKN